MGVLERGDRDQDNETDLKEGGVIEMSTTVLHSRAAPSLEYLLLLVHLRKRREQCLNLNLKNCSRVVHGVVPSFQSYQCRQCIPTTPKLCWQRYLK